MPASKNWSFLNRIKLSLCTVEGRGKPWNLDSFAAVSHRILQTGPWNLAKFAAENCGLYWSLGHVQIDVTELSWPVGEFGLVTSLRMHQKTLIAWTSLGNFGEYLVYWSWICRVYRSHCSQNWSPNTSVASCHSKMCIHTMLRRCWNSFYESCRHRC